MLDRDVWRAQVILPILIVAIATIATAAVVHFANKFPMTIGDDEY
jgi:hypothetical protein